MAKIKAAVEQPPISELTGGEITAAEMPFLTPQRTRLFTIAGGAVVVIALVVWFFVTLGQRKEAFAAGELEKGREMAESNNLGGAAKQFETVMTDYRGTSASFDATIGLAQVRLIADQNELAIGTLNKFIQENPPAEYAAPANGLLGTAYENTGKLPEAIAAYKKSSEEASTGFLKASALLDAARASRNAGKKDDAIKYLKEIMDKYKDAPVATDAELMLGEIQAGKTG